MEQPKKRMGAPKKDPKDLLVQKSIRALARQWDKVDRNGGPEWVRELIDNAPDRPIK